VADLTNIRETVGERYARAATLAAGGAHGTRQAERAAAAIIGAGKPTGPAECCDPDALRTRVVSAPHGAETVMPWPAALVWPALSVT
jgi:hypothetical protein